jgi:hypothetical protein
MKRKYMWLPAALPPPYDTRQKRHLVSLAYRARISDFRVDRLALKLPGSVYAKYLERATARELARREQERITLERAIARAIWDGMAVSERVRMFGERGRYPAVLASNEMAVAA